MVKYKLSSLAENLTSLAISNLSEKIEAKKSKDGYLFNFTVGDFSPRYFPIPRELEEEIVKAYGEKHTNYSYVGGTKELRDAIAKHLKLRGQFEYNANEIIVASGARPLIYLLFKVLVDPGEKVVYTIPSWNTQQFIYLSNAVPITITARAENNFLITADDLKPHLKKAVLVNINSPLNPAGTIFNRKQLGEILDLIVEENQNRINNNRKPIYIFFDIVYWLLVYHHSSELNPMEINPRIKEYAIFVDGISKCFAATGIRVGWAFGPQPIIEKMRSMLAHLGAWAPKPEQIAIMRYLEQSHQVDIYLNNIKSSLLKRLNIFYDMIQNLKNLGYSVDAIKPQGAIYLAIKIDSIGDAVKTNFPMKNADDIMNYLMKKAHLAMVPFHYFGMEKSLPWFRLSVGTCSIDETKSAAAALKQAIINLH